MLGGAYGGAWEEKQPRDARTLRAQDSIGICHADAQEICGQLVGSEWPTTHAANAMKNLAEEKQHSVVDSLQKKSLKHRHVLPAGTWNVAETRCVFCF